MNKEVRMPKMSDSMKTGVLAAWKKEQGESVAPGDVLFEVETDKVVSEIQAQDAGVLEKVCFEEGDEVAVGETVAIIRVQ